MPGAMLPREMPRTGPIGSGTDDESWRLPVGAAEPGGSFARTAVAELSEETGVEVAEEGLVPSGCLSEVGLHTI